MRNSFILFVALMCSVLSVEANPVGQKKAQTVARKFLQAKKQVRVDAIPFELSAETKSRMGASETVTPSFYVFNSSDDAGFVIVSGDDRFPEVIGYSFDGGFSSDEGMPEALQSFLLSMDEYVNDVRAGRADAPLYANGVSTGTPVVEPLLTCQWNQSGPYNMYTPLVKDQYGQDTKNHSVTGCIATAQSQLMYRWKWPEQGRGSMKYNSGDYGILKATFEDSTFNWSLLKDKFNAATDKKTDAGKEVSKLCYSVGLATHMRFGESSGAYDQYSLLAYYKYFRYKSSTLKRYLRDYMGSQEEWNRIIKRELNAGRPIQVAASSSSGGGSDAGGHAFVCDGYDTVDFVHINWGWGGRYDGYYAIHLLDGGGYQFSDDQSIIVGIMPDFTGVDTLDIQIPPCVNDAPRVKGDVKSVKVGGSGDTFYIDFDSVYNRNPYSNDYMYGVGLYDKNGNFVEEASVNSTSNTFFLQAWYGFVAFTSDRGGITCKLKNSYNAGDYTLRLIFKQKNTETGKFFDGWALPYMKGGDAKNQIPVYIHDGNAYFHQVSSAINDIEGEGAQVKSVQLYDVEGREILSPKDGQLVIEKQTLYNGKTKTFKRVAH